MGKRDFLSLLDCSPEELTHLIERARHLKALQSSGKSHRYLEGKTAAMILELSSTRTRVAFEVGLHQLGGHVLNLDSESSQLGRGEPVEDTAQVLSGMVDLVIIRTLDHQMVEAFARHATIPVINAMTSLLHPCQLLADIQTFEEHRGTIQGRTVAFVGDGYNMCHSYINAARQWGFHLKIACPEGYTPNPEILASTNNAELVDSPQEAVKNADLVVTDVWSSMGHEGQEGDRCAVFAPYQVNEDLLSGARDDVLFMHCLPAHRGEEVNDTVLNDPRSVVYAEAHNRLHSQKALMEFLLASA